jgi:hypothetical protein
VTWSNAAVAAYHGAERQGCAAKAMLDLAQPFVSMKFDHAAGSSRSRSGDVRRWNHCLRVFAS